MVGRRMFGKLFIMLAFNHNERQFLLNFWHRTKCQELWLTESVSVTSKICHQQKSSFDVYNMHYSRMEVEAMAITVLKDAV